MTNEKLNDIRNRWDISRKEVRRRYFDAAGARAKDALIRLYVLHGLWSIWARRKKC